MNPACDKKDCCNYLSENQLECLVTKGGLYIPMPEHIELFCKGDNYVQCHQYIMGCEECRESAKKFGHILDESRRRYRRVREHLSLQLSNCNESGEILDVLDQEAFTVDLSLGGFRFETHHEIPAKKRIAFSFGKDFSSPSWLGFGEVRWTKPLDYTDTFQSGLTFTDSQTFQAIGKHMGVSGLPMM